MSNPIWAVSATVTDIGEGDDGHSAMGLSLLGRRVMLPVNLPSEAQQIAKHFGERVTLAMLAPDGDAKSLEEQIVWHRSEVARLRELFASNAFPDRADGRVEIGRATVVVTCRGEDSERRVERIAAEMIANEETTRRVAEANDRAKKADENSKLLFGALNSAMLIIDAAVASEARGEIVIRGRCWDDLKRFAKDVGVRKWLRGDKAEEKGEEAAQPEEPDDVEMRSPDAERQAWARLVRAECEMGTGPTCGDGLAAARAEYESAKQALRDLGVDVDALLEER